MNDTSPHPGAAAACRELALSSWAPDPLAHAQSDLERARTSFRPVAIEGRAAAWRTDDSLLHVDAFKSRPTRGTLVAAVDPTRPREPFQAFDRKEPG